jgi:outer membrane murein-binding lipoprotein Lpp
MQAKKKMRFGFVAAALAAGLVLSGCSSSSEEEAAPTEAASAPAAADGLATAKASYDAALAASLTFAYPGDAFDASAASGKKVAMISINDQIPVLKQWTDTIAAGLESQGVTVTQKSDAGGVIDPLPKFFAQAVTDQVDLIITNAVPAALIPLTDLGDIPVMTTNQTAAPGVAVADGIAADPSFDYTIAASLMADWFCVTGAGAGNAVVWGSEGQASSPIMIDTIKARVAEVCPDAKVDYQDAPLATWFDGTLDGVAKNAVTADPSITHLMPIYDGMTIATGAGIDAAGSAAIQSSFNMTPAVAAGIGTSSVKMDVGCPNDWFSYATVDAGLRLLTGNAVPDNYGITCKVFDESNIGSIDATVENSVNWYGIDFAAEFAKFWTAS